MSLPNLKLSNQQSSHKNSGRYLTFSFFCLLILLQVFIACGDDKTASPTPKTVAPQNNASTEVGNQFQDFLIAHSINGNAKFQKGVQKKWNELKVGQKLKSGFLVKTGKDTKLTMKLPDASTITLLGGSLASIEDIMFAKSKRKTEIYLASGDLLFHVKKLANVKTQIQFSTPTATAAIRGTKGGISTNGKSSVAYLENGKLEVNDHESKSKSKITGLQYLYQTSKGFVTSQAKDKNELSRLFNSKKSWMNALKSPVIKKLYSPARAQKFFKQELEKKLGKNLSSLLQSGTSQKSFKKEASKQLKQQGKNKFNQSVSPRIKKGKNQIRNKVNKKVNNGKKKASEQFNKSKSDLLNKL